MKEQIQTANRKTFEKWITIIEATIEKKEEALDNCREDDEVRRDLLEEELRMLEEMANLLDDYVNLI